MIGSHDEGQLIEASYHGFESDSEGIEDFYIEYGNASDIDDLQTMTCLDQAIAALCGTPADKKEVKDQ